MTAWKITAKTIYCEAVDDEVTLLIHSNGVMRCTGCRKYNEPNSITRSAIREKTRRLKRGIQCEGETCTRVTQYKGKILAEDNT
jgi:TATA-box binding protein (TBP) (component of TFIID and TFIIIB)